MSETGVRHEAPLVVPPRGLRPYFNVRKATVKAGVGTRNAGAVSGSATNSAILVGAATGANKMVPRPYSFAAVAVGDNPNILKSAEWRHKPRLPNDTFIVVLRPI